MPFATPYGTPRRDLLRWGFCFAVAVAAHGGAAAFALLQNAPTAPGFDAGAPVAMIDLPDVPAASATPPNDMAPGLAEPEAEQAPPPEEETKPPEDAAEIALPESEPPKPEPPAEEKPATAPPSVAMVQTAPVPQVAGAEVQPSAAVRRWESALVAHIERFKRYPAEARARGERGLAQVAFTIDRDGRVRNSRIVESSGSPELDRETLAMLIRAQPVPKPPRDMQVRELSFVVPVRFNIK